MAKSVLIYTNHYYPENFKINDVVDYFNSVKFKVTVITCVPNYPSGKLYKGYGFLKFKEIKGNVTIYRLPIITRGNGKKIRLVLNYFSYFFSVIIFTLYISIFKKKIDNIIVHHTSPIFITISPILYKFFKRKVNLILWDLDIWPDTLVALKLINNIRLIEYLQKYVNKIYNNYSKILVSSKAYVKILKERNEKLDIVYFPNWAEDVFIENKIIKPLEYEEKEFKGLKIMFAGNIGKSQNIEEIFDVIIDTKDLNISWLFVGDGRMKSWLELMVNKKKLNNKVFFLGNYPVKYMPYFFSIADIMLISLKNELAFRNTVPAKLQAYMASSKPILANIYGESADIINSSDCGWVVENKNDFKYKIFEIMELSILELKAKGTNGSLNYKNYFEKINRFKQLHDMI